MRANALPDAEKTCDGCGNPFTPKRHWARFCKTACRNDWHGRNAPPYKQLADLQRQVAALKAGNEELSRRVGEMEAAVAKVGT